MFRMGIFQKDIVTGLPENLKKSIDQHEMVTALESERHSMKDLTEDIFCIS